MLSRRLSEYQQNLNTVPLGFLQKQGSESSAPPPGQCAFQRGLKYTQPSPSWIKYLGCHGVRRFSRFRSSTRCFSSRHRFCSVAASMSPSRRCRVTSRQSFLDSKGPCFSRGLILFGYASSAVVSMTLVSPLL